MSGPIPHISQDDAHAALEVIRLCLNGELHWEGVGPKPWWASFDVLDELVHGGLIEQYVSLERLHEGYYVDAQQARARVAELEEQFETLQAAAMRLCNVHRWSYGGPETLVALADRIAESNPASSRCTCTRDGEGFVEMRGCPEHAPAKRPKEGE